MLDELISKSLLNFQSDCLNFSEQNYPTVHNRGIKEIHLGKALARRMLISFEKKQTKASFTLLEDPDTVKQSVFLIDSSEHQIVIVVHRLISANLASRKSLVKDVSGTLDLIDKSSSKEMRLIIIADHWADKSNASKSMPSWWLGHQPIHQVEYAKQGIKLLEADHFLSDEIEQACKLKEGQYRIYHPLHRYKDGLPFFKYMILAAIYSL